ncbi:MAG: nucleotidyltransferase domain-containing protein [Thermoplasmatota archaeon]
MDTKRLLNRLEQFPHFDRLEFVYLFGSAAHGDATTRSDIDLCLYYDISNREKLADLLFTISGSLPQQYDVSMFQLLPLYMQKEVFKGQLLFARDTGFVHDVARRTRQAYNDFEARYRYILRSKAGMEATL